MITKEGKNKQKKIIHAQCCSHEIFAVNRTKGCPCMNVFFCLLVSLTFFSFQKPLLRELFFLSSLRSFACTAACEWIHKFYVRVSPFVASPVLCGHPDPQSHFQYTNAAEVLISCPAHWPQEATRSHLYANKWRIIVAREGLDRIKLHWNRRHKNMFVPLPVP